MKTSFILSIFLLVLFCLTSSNLFGQKRKDLSGIPKKVVLKLPRGGTKIFYRYDIYLHKISPEERKELTASNLDLVGLKTTQIKCTQGITDSYLCNCGTTKSKPCTKKFKDNNCHLNPHSNEAVCTKDLTDEERN